MNIYIFNQKIDGQFLDMSIISQPIRMMEKLRNFLLFTEKIDCTDNRGYIDLKYGQAKNHFLIFGKDKKKFFREINSFCTQEEVFLLNYADKSELRIQENIFFKGNQRVKDHIGSLKEDYDMHKANKDIFKMATCIKLAEDIVSGKIKIN